MVGFTIKDKRGIWVASLTVVFIILLGNLPRLASSVTRFGLEYGCIADSVARGDGFANPFCYPTGPTAWMPPGYVWLMALVFKLFGPLSTLSASVLLLFKALGLGLAVYLFNRAALDYGLEHREKLSFCLAAAFVANSSWVGGELFDRWLAIMLSAALLAVFAGGKGGPGWGLVAPLVQPALAVGYLCVAWTRRREANWAPVTVAAILLSFFAWTTRNYLALGVPYPIKSNAAYEFYMTNAWDQDGVLSGSTLQRCHPVHAANQAALEYRKLGERQFLAIYRERSLALLKQAPLQVARKCLTRLRNSLIWLEGANDLSFVSPRVDERDIHLLVEKGLLRSGAYYQFWLVTEWNEDTFNRALDGLPLQDRRRALRSWRHARKVVLGERYSPVSIVWGFAFAGLPTLAFLVGLRRGAWTHRSFREPAILYFVCLLPYQLISHYSRYQMAVMGLQVWLVWWVFLRGTWWSAPRPSQLPAGGSGGGRGE